MSLVRNCIVPLLISVFFHQFTKQDVLVVIYLSGADGHHTITLKLVTLTVLREEREGDLLSVLCDQLNNEGLMRDLGDKPCLGRLEVGFFTEGNL